MTLGCEECARDRERFVGIDEAAIEVVPATIEHWDLLAALFAGSKGVNTCWCMWPLRPPTAHQPGHDNNKAAMRSRLLDGESPGLLALSEERAVGWCACGPRHIYPQYESGNEGTTSWAIPCIYIDPAADRKAVAGALIRAATELAVRNVAHAIEGPPPWWLPGDAKAIAVATATFLENGFTQIGPGARMPELRRVLA
jgi:GNAT superfamily N-acetyltransferase